MKEIANMKTEDDVRSQVQEAYGQAISRVTSCCGDASPGNYSGTIGYTADEATAVGEEVAGASMGCGNPLAFSEVQEGETVLDLGSGAGFDLLIAAEKVGLEGRVIGVDMTPEMIATAEANIAASGHRNIEIRQGVIENLPVENESVDWVISNCVINLSPEKQKVFDEISRVLKPSGRFSISDIVVSNFPEHLRDHRVLYNSCIAGAISEEEYLAGLQTAGLVEVGVNKRVEFTSELITAIDIKDYVGVDPSEGCGCAPVETQQDLAQLARELQGRIQSLNFIGYKP
jgi:SAM-dependent methyltransferase